jgi:hypothetical protein
VSQANFRIAPLAHPDLVAMGDIAGSIKRVIRPKSAIGRYLPNGDPQIIAQ